MKKLKLLPVLIAYIVLCSGCSASSPTTSASALPLNDVVTEITVEVNDIGGFYQEAALEFEQVAGVKVNLINHYSEEQSVNDQDYAYLDRIPGELMSGKGSDVYASIYLDFSKIGKQGYLCNLADWIAADPDFSYEKYYLNIMRAEFDEGDVYTIPLSIIFMALGADVEITELNGKYLNWEEFFELTKGINRNSVLLSLTDYEIFIRRFTDRYQSFIDEESNLQSLDTSEIVKLLEQSKAWSEQGLCIPYNADNLMNIFDNSFIKEYGGDVNLLTNVRSMRSDNEPYWYDIPSDSEKNDKSNKIVPSDFICINAASPNKGTAWRFVKFLLRKDTQNTNYLFPVNRETAAEMIDNVLTHCIGYGAQGNDVEKAIKETETTLNAVFEVPQRANRSYIIKNVIGKEAKRFFYGEMSAEETAQSMAEAVKLYLKEQ